jgi:ubiquinone/menaquinone biosynthesis C-methylase UbiE
MTRDAETQRVRGYYDDIADDYDTYVGYMERLLFGEDRQWVGEQACGDVLEIAVGTGRNLPYYPPHARLTGVDLTPGMLAVARRRAASLGRAADLRIGDAQTLDFSDASFDTVVATLALSSIPNDRQALTEAWRVLRPGGRLLLVEHVRSPHRLVRTIQRILNPLSVRLHANHLLRDPLDHLEDVGFVAERVERAKWGLMERVSARKPVSHLDAPGE